MALKILNGIDVIGSMNIAAGDVPSLDASKITSGTINSSRIPSLDASKITSGTISASRMPNIDASKINSGAIAASRLPDLSGTYALASHNHNTSYDAIGSADAVNSRIDTEVLPAIPTNNNQLANGQQYYNDLEVGGGITAYRAGESLLHISNSDRGSAQNIFKTVYSNSGSVRAFGNSDWIALYGDGGINTYTVGNYLYIRNTDGGGAQRIFKNVVTDNGEYSAPTNDSWLPILGGANISTRIAAGEVTIDAVGLLPLTGGTLTDLLKGPQFWATGPSPHIRLGEENGDQGSISLNNGILNISGASSHIYFDLLAGAHVGIGLANPSEKLHVDGNILASGDVTAFSDRRSKDNIETIPNALDKVNKMRGVLYNKKSNGEASTGVIAQEIEEILPQVVKTDNEGMKSVAYGNIVGVLIEAIKEQQNQIEELKSRLDGFTN